jgi:hypothetical protein
LAFIYLRDVLLGYLAEKLSARTSELVINGKPFPPEAVVQALAELEQEGLVRHSHDSVLQEDLFSPTAKGILLGRKHAWSY